METCDISDFCLSPIMHLIWPPKFCITFVFHFSWVLQPSQEKLKTMHLIKRMRRGDATATIPWVPEVFSRVRRRASFRRPQADTCSAEGRRHERRLTETGNRASGTQGTATSDFVNCRRTVLKLNFKGPYLILERKLKFRRCLFTFSKTRN